MVPTLNTAVVAKGLGRLTDAYRNLPKIAGLTQAMLLEYQELENVFWTILNGVNLNPTTPPTGQLLTNIAAILNIARNGLTDIQLWTAFKLELLILRSRGRSEDVLQVINAITPASILEFPIVTMVLSAWNMQLGLVDFATLVEGLGEAKDGGARLFLNYSTWSDGNDFEWSDSFSGTGGQGTWGDSVAGIVGGLLVSTTEVIGL